MNIHYNKMNSSLIQFVAFGEQNISININKNYALEFNPYLMKMEFNECDEEKNYFYKLDWGRESDQIKLFGLIIEQDNQNNNLNNLDIDIEISKMELEIFSYGMDLKSLSKIPDKIYYIGSIPLILGEIISNQYSNSILIKFLFPFFKWDKYFCGFSNYNFRIKSKIKFKNITLQTVMRYDDTIERRIISMVNSIFAKFNYQYASKITNIPNKHIINNKMSFEYIIIDYAEKIKGLYFTVPIELVGLVDSVQIKIGPNTNLINFDLFKIINESNSVNLYWIGFDSSIPNLDIPNPQDTQNTQNTQNLVVSKSVKIINDCVITFNFNMDYIDTNQLELINSQILNLSIFPVFINQLVWIGFVPKLKYSNCQLNTLFSLDEKDIIIKFSNNNDLFVKDLLDEINIKNKNIELDDKLYNSVREYLGIGN